MVELEEDNSKFYWINFNNIKRRQLQAPHRKVVDGVKRGQLEAKIKLDITPSFNWRSPVE